MVRNACRVFRDSSNDWWLLLSVMLVVVGYLGPWVPHKAAALTVTGLELAEFAKFFPQVQGGTVPVVRVLFYLPLVTVLILLALLAGRSTVRIARLGVPLCGVILLLVVLLPYSVVDSVRQAISTRSSVAFDPQYTGQLALVAVGVVFTLLAPLARRLPHRAWVSWSLSWRSPARFPRCGSLLCCARSSSRCTVRRWVWGGV